MSDVATTERIEAARSGDAFALARLHRRALPGSGLASLATPALWAMYAALASDPQIEILVARRGEAPIGFVVGSGDGTAAIRRWRARLPVGVLLRLSRATIRQRATEVVEIRSDRALPRPELLAIVVDPSVRGTGIGTRLVRELLDRLRRAGCRELKVLIASDNEPMNLFYAVLGFQLRSTIESTRGRRSNVWVYWWPAR